MELVGYMAQKIELKTDNAIATGFLCWKNYRNIPCTKRNQFSVKIFQRKRTHSLRQ